MSQTATRFCDGQRVEIRSGIRSKFEGQHAAILVILQPDTGPSDPARYVVITATGEIERFWEFQLVEAAPWAARDGAYAE